MKNYLKTFGLIILLFLCIISGCKKEETYGQTISSDIATTNIKEILTSSEKYENKTIKLEGTIGQVCPTGCWFFLKDKTAETIIDIKPYGLAIPKRTGKQATVEGTISKNQNGQYMFIGQGVKIK